MQYLYISNATSPEASIDTPQPAIIHINGVLQEESGYSIIRQFVEEANEDESVDELIFYIHSPGGAVRGCIETAKTIQTSTKPTVAICDTACSAAYKLACSCDLVHAYETSTIGNIGVILPYIDESKALDGIGIEKKAFTNADAFMKSSFFTNELSPKQKEKIQADIDELGKTFIEYVITNRPFVDTEEIKSGMWYSGPQALKHGLVDQIVSR